jgi:hypothetical protein
MLNHCILLLHLLHHPPCRHKTLAGGWIFILDMMAHRRMGLTCHQRAAKLHDVYRIAWTDHGSFPSFEFSMALDGFD